MDFNINNLSYDKKIELIKNLINNVKSSLLFTDLVSLTDELLDEVKLRMNFQVSNSNGLFLYDTTPYDTEEEKRKMFFTICDNLLIGINGKNDLLIGAIDNENNIALIKSFIYDEKSFLAFKGSFNKDEMSIYGSWSILDDYTSFMLLLDKLNNSINYSDLKTIKIDLETINQSYKESDDGLKNIVISLFYKTKSLSLKKRDERHG